MRKVLKYVIENYHVVGTTISKVCREKAGFNVEAVPSRQFCGRCFRFNTLNLRAASLCRF